MATTRYVDRNGRLIRYDSTFCWSRFGSILAVVFLLFVSNPTNNPDEPWRSRRTTNYGIFSVKERTTRLHILIAGMNWECPYMEDTYVLFPNDNEWPPLGVFCRILRDQLTHEKNLLYEPNDPVHTVHRLLAIVTIVVNLVGACFTKPRDLERGIRLWDGLASMFVDSHSQQHPVSALSYKLLSLNVVVHPTLQSMYQIAQLQRISWLGRFESTANIFFFSVCCLSILSILVNVTSKYLVERFIGWNCLLIVATGYQSALSSVHGTASSYSEQHVSWDLLIYSTIAIYCTQQPFFFTLSMLLGFLVGNYFGAYQFVGVRYDNPMSRYVGTFGRWVNKLWRY